MRRETVCFGVLAVQKIWHLAVSSKMSIDVSPGMMDITCHVATELTISLSIDCHSMPMMVDSGRRLLAQDFRHPAETLKTTTLKPEKTLQDMHEKMLIMRR